MTGKVVQPVQTHQQTTLTHQMAVLFQTEFGAADFVTVGFSHLGGRNHSRLRRLHGRITKSDTRKIYN